MNRVIGSFFFFSCKKYFWNMDYAMSQLSRMQIIYIAKGRKEKDFCKLGLNCDGNRCPHNRLKIHLFDV